MTGKMTRQEAMAKARAARSVNAAKRRADRINAARTRREAEEQASKILIGPQASDVPEPSENIHTDCQIPDTVPRLDNLQSNKFIEASNQYIARLTIPAVSFLGDIISGQVSAPPQVRLNASLEVLRMAGTGVKKHEDNQQPDISAIVRDLARIVSLRSSSAEAIDVTPTETDNK